jgi:hypothetical protein
MHTSINGSLAKQRNARPGPHVDIHVGRQRRLRIAPPMFPR